MASPQRERISPLWRVFMCALKLFGFIIRSVFSKNKNTFLCVCFGFLIFNFEKRFLATRRVATRCVATCRVATCRGLVARRLGHLGRGDVRNAAGKGRGLTKTTPLENGGYRLPASRLTVPFRRSLPCGFLLGFIAPFFRGGGLMCSATGAVNNPCFQTGAGILGYPLFHL